jgi:hypothetical protein
MRHVDQLSELSTYFKEVHQVDVSVEEFQELEQIWWDHTNQKRAVCLATGDPILTAEFNSPRADVGKVVGFIAGAVLGAFLLPGIGLVAGWIAGAAIGGAIGYRLAGLFDRPQQQQSPTRSTSDPIFAFSGVGNLAQLGQPINLR